MIISYSRQVTLQGLTTHHMVSVTLEAVPALETAEFIADVVHRLTVTWGLDQQFQPLSGPAH